MGWPVRSAYGTQSASAVTPEIPPPTSPEPNPILASDHGKTSRTVFAHRFSGSFPRARSSMRHRRGQMAAADLAGATPVDATNPPVAGETAGSGGFGRVVAR